MSTANPQDDRLQQRITGYDRWQELYAWGFEIDASIADYWQSTLASHRERMAQAIINIEVPDWYTDKYKSDLLYLKTRFRMQDEYNAAIHRQRYRESLDEHEEFNRLLHELSAAAGTPREREIYELMNRPGEYARSKMFRSTLNVVPINHVTWVVAGCPRD